MPSIICEVVNKKGMHARAAAKIVSLISEFKSNVTLTHHQTSAPGDSLLKLLTLNAPIGSKIEIEADGADSDELLNQLQVLFLQGFGE